MSNREKFSKWRARLWPIRGEENSKFFPLLFMKFCVSFNYTILHTTKDTLIVTMKNSGAEVIPILKGWVVLVSAILFMLFYSKLSNRLSVSQLFYASLTPFLLFFATYALFLYPNREWLSPHESADQLVSMIGVERAHWVAIYRHWMDALFFLMAELWGGVVIGLLFWGFANRISTMNEASRFYTLLSAGGHIGVMSSGPLIWYFSTLYGKNEFVYTVQAMMGMVTLVTFLIMGAYWITDRYVTTSVEQVKKITKNKKQSLWSSLTHLLNSPSLICITLMVIGYGLSVNMIEVLWKGTLKIRYPDSKDYQAFMGVVSSATGGVSLLLALFVGGNVMRKFGWHFSAQLTPVILTLASLAFLGAFFYGTWIENDFLTIGSGALAGVTVCGAFHSVACKSMKYCLFDPTKEMAYISLDEESQVKGKAAVDVVASRFGKSGSSWIQIALIEFMGAGSVLAIAPYLTPFIVMALIAWISSIYLLAKQRNEDNFVLEHSRA